MDYKTLVDELNNCIKEHAPPVYDMLSNLGKRMYYLKGGIAAQSMEATNANVSVAATVGIACFENGEIMHLKHLSKHFPELNSNEIFSYASDRGLNEFRKIWFNELLIKNPTIEYIQHKLNNNELSYVSLPIVVNGITQGISIFARLFCNENDFVIINDLHWTTYDLIFQAQCNATLYPVSLYYPNENKILLKPIIEAIEKNNHINKFFIILNFPMNPIGYTPTHDETIEFCIKLKNEADKGKKIIILCDDAYFGLNHDDKAIKESIFSYLLLYIHENIIIGKIDGMSKEDYAWGLRIGFLTIGLKYNNKNLFIALEDKIAGLILSTLSNVNHPTQEIFLKNYKYHLNEYNNEKLKLKNELYQRYIVLNNLLLNKKKDIHLYYDILPFNSGFFMCIKPKDRNISTEMIRKKLISYSVGVINIGYVLRINYAKISSTQLEYLLDACITCAKECTMDSNKKMTNLY